MVIVGEGERGMTSESHIETCALPFGKWITGGNLMYVAGNQKWVLCDDIEG